MTVQVVGFFCEDIREEKNGQVSIVGILPDHIQLPPPPAAMLDKKATAIIPKLGLYVRMLIPMEDALQPMQISLTLPDSTSLHLGEVDSELMEKARSEARAGGLPIAGVVFHAAMQGFQIPQAGQIVAVLKSGDTLHQFAVLNVKPPTEA
jgi:hypothetical protein